MSFAKSGEEHIRDMIDVYPFDVQKDDLIYIFFECVQAAIDYSDFDPKNQNKESSKKPAFLKSSKLPFMQTTWAYKGPYNHRFWYHWGFQVKLKNVKHLADKVEENIENNRMKEEHRELFYQCLQKEVNKRNTELMGFVTEIFGYPPLVVLSETGEKMSGISPAMRAQVNAFVAIPYAVHLLGDHIEGKVLKVLQPMDGIVKSVYKAIDDLGGKENVQLAKNLRGKLSRYEKSPEDFLNALKEYMPGYMLSLKGGIYDIENMCRKKGYKVKGRFFSNGFLS